MSGLGAAYSSGAAAWADGPTRVYARLAERLVAFCPVPVRGRRVLDLGSGTGGGSRAAVAAGARVVEVDLALGMLRHERATRPPATVGDIVRLPFAADSFDIALAPFSLNHLDDPAAGVREAGRVAATIVASTYADDDHHVAKDAVDAALVEAGWTRPDWYVHLKSAIASWGTVAAARDAIERGGMGASRVERMEIELPDLGPHDMVAWRLGLAQSATFVEQLTPAAQQRLHDRALELLGADPPPVVRRVIFLAATRPQ